MKWLHLKIAILCLLMSSTLLADAKNLVNDPETFKEVAGELRCPTCTGLSVLDSEAPFSVQIKNEVKEQLAAGKTHDEVLTFFVDRYGPWILRSPPVKGVNAFAWIVPILALVLGPILIWFFVGRRRRVLTTDSMRSTEVIVAEMKERLQKMESERKSAGANI